MSTAAESDLEARQRARRLGDVMRNVLARRAAGEVLADEDVIAASPDLMPELGEELRRARMIDAARTARSPDDRDAQHRARGADAFAGYRVVRRIHQGGQGVVYEAVHRQTQRRVAIKVLRSTFGGTRERARFEREVQILRQLNHPHIITVLESGLTDGRFYYAMDYVPGQALDVFMATHTVSIAETLMLFARICAAVNAAHLHGVIHRDLKPGNIIIDPNNDPHVLDFGLAKFLATERTSTDEAAAEHPDQQQMMTMTGQFVGSLPWSSPEQAEGRHDLIDMRSDVYSLGVLLYQMLTNRFPYDVVGNMKATLDNILTFTPPPPSRIRPRINNEVDTIVLKCLAKEPQRRYQSAGEIERDIVHYLSGRPIEAKRDSAWYVLRKTLSRHRIAVGIAASLLVVITTAAVISTAFWRSAVRERDRAREAEQLADQRLRQTITARDEARSAIRRAQRESEKLEQVSDFLQRILAGANPLQSGGHEITVRQALDAAAARIEAELGSQPEIQAAVHATIGRAYHGAGLYEPAERHLRRSLELCAASRAAPAGGTQASQPAAVVESALTSIDLADLLRDRGRYVQAEQLYRTALQTISAQPGANDADVAAAQARLGSLLAHMGNFADAEWLLRESLATRRRLLGERHPDVTESLTDLAGMLMRKGASDESEAILTQTLATQRRWHGNEHPLVAETLNDLGALAYARGRHAEAEALYREALAMRRKLLGDQHPAVAGSLNDLAVLLRATGDVAAAESLHRQALDLRRRLLGGHHADVAESLNNLALLLGGRVDAEAESYLLEAERIYRASFGDEHPALASTLSNRAFLLMSRGDTTAADALYREALAIRRKLLSDEHPDVARTLVNLAELLRARGELPAAEPLAHEAVELNRRSPAATSQADLADSLVVLGMIQAEQGDAPSAERTLREALDLRRSTLAPDDWLIADTASALGACLAAQQRYDEAEPLLAAALAILRAALGDDDPRTQRTSARLAALQRAEGKP